VLVLRPRAPPRCDLRPSDQPRALARTFAPSPPLPDFSLPSLKITFRPTWSKSRKPTRSSTSSRTPRPRVRRAPATRARRDQARLPAGEAAVGRQGADASLARFPSLLSLMPVWSGCAVVLVLARPLLVLLLRPPCAASAASFARASVRTLPPRRPEEGRGQVPALVQGRRTRLQDPRRGHQRHLHRYVRADVCSGCCCRRCRRRWGGRREKGRQGRTGTRMHRAPWSVRRSTLVPGGRSRRASRRGI
jgi:hypothetical protein